MCTRESLLEECLCCEDMELRSFAEHQLHEKLYVDKENVRSLDMDFIMKLFHSGDGFLVGKAKEAAILKHKNYIYHIIHTVYGTYSYYTEDLFQCGAVGVLYALGLYDSTRSSFTTFCRPYILHEMSAYVSWLNGNSTAYYSTLQKRVRGAISELEQCRDEITAAKISAITNLPVEIAERELRICRSSEVPFGTYDEMERLAPLVGKPQLDTMAEQLGLKLDLEGAMRKLDSRTRRVLVMAYYYNFTNQQIAAFLHMGLKDVRNERRKGLSKLRSDSVLEEEFGCF